MKLLGLQWEDVDFENLTIAIRRGIVNGVVDDVKTEYSESELPLDPEFASILLSWKAECPATGEGWLFPNASTGRPYDPSTIRKRYLRAAGRKLGFGDISGILSGTPIAVCSTRWARRWAYNRSYFATPVFVLR